MLFYKKENQKQFWFYQALLFHQTDNYIQTCFPLLYSNIKDPRLEWFCPRTHSIHFPKVLSIFFCMNVSLSRFSSILTPQVIQLQFLPFRRSFHFFEELSVAARLRSLRTNDPLNKGHPRSIEMEIELCQTYFRNYQTNHFYLINHVF